jgi:membrane-bound lytic murein transglycosylase D
MAKHTTNSVRPVSARCGFWLALVPLVLVSCRSSGPEEDYSALNLAAEVIQKPGTPTIDAVIDSVEKREVEAEAATPATAAEEPEVGDEISHATTEKIPMEINAAVERWIEYFTVKDRERFLRFMERGEKYKSMITAVLKDQGIPTEIYYQAMIESGFATHATSTASAVGVWQFIKPTGQRYGLRVDSYVDERRDPMRATIAAALYMKDLHNVFQDWYLAMAAYNAGEGRILGAIMRAKTRDFWEMVRRNALPSETMDYIPKFLAATTIGHNPRRYGFDDIATQMNPPLTPVAVPSPVRLADIASVSGVAHETLKEFNPNLMKGVTPPGVAEYKIWVPKDQAWLVEKQLTRLASMRLRNMPSPVVADKSGKPQFVRVRRGDTLGGISRTYNVPIATLRRLNRISGNQLYVGARVKLWDTVAATSAQAPRAKATASATSGQSYRVKRGDNLNAIAKRFNLSVEELKRINSLRRNTIYVGQLLRVGQRAG